MDWLTMLLSLVGLTPTQAIAILYNLAMGAISVPVTNWLKTALAQIPWLADETAVKIKGWITPILSGIVGLIFVWVGTWFGVSVFTDPTFFNNLVVALGFNATAAQSLFNWLKDRKKS